MKQIYLSFFLIISFLFTSVIEGRSYFVSDLSGNDTLNGLYSVHQIGTNNGPWKSIEKVFNFSNIADGFLPGDSILFKSGETFFAGTGNLEYLAETFGSSGSLGLPIVLSSFGGNVKPIIRVGSTQKTVWEPSPVSGVWQSLDSTYATFYLFEDDIARPKATSVECLDGNWYHYDETWSGGQHWNRLYYRPTAKTPSDHTVFFARGGSLAFDDQSYISISQLSFRSSYGAITAKAINNSISDITVSYCDFYSQFVGFQVIARFYDAYRINFLNNKTRYLVWPVQYYGQGDYDTVGHNFFYCEVAYNDILDCNLFYSWKHQDQEAIYMQNINNTHIHHNKITGGQCTAIAIWYGDGGTCFKNIIEHNFMQDIRGLIPRNLARPISSSYIGGNAGLDICFGNIFRYNIYMDVDMALNTGNCWCENEFGQQVYNNTFYGNGVGINFRYTGHDGPDWMINNNIFFSPKTSVNVPQILHMVHENYHIGFESDYNLFFPDTDSLWKLHATPNNMFDADTGLYVGFNEWIGLMTADTHSLISASVFVDTNVALKTDSSCLLLWNSPAIDGGVSFGQSVDYFGNPIYGTPDMGAVEYQPPFTMGVHRIDSTGNIRIYSNGQFRNSTYPSAITKKISIAPINGFNNSDYSFFMDLEIVKFDTSYVELIEKQDTVNFDTLEHKIGELTIGASYNVIVDSMNIGLYAADSVGSIVFNSVNKTVETTVIITIDTSITKVTDFNNEINGAILYQNSPNPFNPTTEINYRLPKNISATYYIYNIAGKLIRSFGIAKNKKNNRGTIIWNSRDSKNKQVPSGLYLGKLITIKGNTKYHRMLLLK